MEATNREFELLMRAKLEQQELINELEQQLLLSQKREMDLREALSAIRVWCEQPDTDLEDSIGKLACEALSTPPTLDDLNAWRDAEIEKVIEMIRDKEDRYGIGNMCSMWRSDDVADDILERLNKHE
jgi:hypothetical protein